MARTAATTSATKAARSPILDDFPAAALTKRRLTAHCDGFSLKCKPNVAATDRPGLERLLRYGARPAFAHNRVEQLPNGNVSSRLPKPCYTGQTHVVLPPVDFLRRLTALVPPPRFHTIRYHGLFAPNAKLCKLTCSLALGHAGQLTVADGATASVASAKAGKTDSDNPVAQHRRRSRMRWSRLLRRVFALDVLRCLCGADRKIIGLLSRAQSPALGNFLRAIGEPSEPPPRAKARPPPQVDLFF